MKNGIMWETADPRKEGKWKVSLGNWEGNSSPQFILHIPYADIYPATLLWTEDTFFSS